MGIYSNYEVYPSIADELCECPFNHECDTCEYDCEEEFKGECIVR